MDTRLLLGFVFASAFGASVAACGSGTSSSAGPGEGATSTDGGTDGSDRGSADGATEGSVPPGSGGPPPAAEVVADMLDQPRGLTVDATTLYWLSIEDDPAIGRRGVYALPKSGGTSTFIADTLNDPQQVIADDTNLYWVDSGGSLLWVAKAGGMYHEVDLPGELRQIALGRPNLYFDEGCYIGRAPSTDLTMQTILTKGDYSASALFALASDRLYWSCPSTAGTKLQTSGLDGSGPTTLATLGGAYVAPSLQVDGVAVYAAMLSANGQANGNIVRVDRGTGKVTPLASGIAFGDSVLRPNVMVVDDTFVYWFDIDRRVLMRTAKDGSGTPAVLATITCKPDAIVQDETYVYAACTGASGSLVRARK